MNQLTPIEEPFLPEVAEILSHYPQRDGYLLQLFRVFARSLRFLKKGTVNLLDRDSPLAMREREIVILRVCANTHCEYEWGVHVGAFAAYVELTEPQIEATWSSDSDAHCWPPEEQLLIRAIDELCTAGRIEDQTLGSFQATWTVEQQLEILALAGNYHTISFVANTARLANESFAVPVPAGRRYVNATLVRRRS
jgi:alkylhydroperoxidase family enzyme